jgi:hypothetical protein
MVMTSTFAFAGEYTLTEGDGNPVCEAYRRNLEPRHNSEPMACERQYDPAITGFSSPHWKKLDLQKNLQLYREAVIALGTHVYEAQGMALSEEDARAATEQVSARIAHLQVELYAAEMPLFGKKEVHVLNVRELGCGIDPLPNVKISRLFLLDGKLMHIDKGLQEKLDGWSNNATVELFNGEPYIETYRSDDNWSTLLTGSGALSVWKPNSDGFELQCRIAYTPSTH